MLYRGSEGKILLTILINVIVLFSFALVFEVILRTTHIFGAKVSWTKPDSMVGYSFIPGKKYWSKSENDNPITGKINSYGWRDREWSLIKPENEFRIAVLGDSFVEAFQVESSTTFLDLAENQLNAESGRSVEIMNFGRSGYTQTEEFIVLKEYVVKFSPNLVILFFFPGNDITDINRVTAMDSRRPFLSYKNGELRLDTSFSLTNEFKIRSFISSIRQYSALISLISDRYILYKVNRSKIISYARSESHSEKINGYLSLCTSKPEKIYIQNYKLVKQIIRDMAAYCQVRAIKFMLVCCDLYLPPELEKKYKDIDPTFDLSFFEDDLKEYAQFINIEYLGLQRIFMHSHKNSGLAYHLKKDGHWNYSGHRLVAKALVSRLKKFNLIEIMHSAILD
jgi:hypothetical protein